MYQLNSIEDTIVAVSTPVGHGGIGIVRLSGRNALSIADKIFKTKNGEKPSKFKSFSARYGWVINNGSGDTIDEALLTVMRSPKSYTKEDVVEISCHGGTVSLRSIMSLMMDLDARPAEPGEFTKRAFINGRIDLTQAEAVLDIIQSKTDAFLKVSTNQLKGELSEELNSIREMLMSIYVEIEAIVNFPEDDLDASGRLQLGKRIEDAEEKVNHLLSSGEQGRILKEGIKIVLCGKPNVGKSSLLNALLKTPRAIVSEIAGTTRDTIEETAQINGIPFQLVDTAGILEPRDLIEKEAVKRSRMYIDQADLVLFILDVSQEFTPEDETVIEHIKGKNILVILNKSDLPSRFDERKIYGRFKGRTVLKTSVLKREGIDKLQEVIVESVWQDGEVDHHGVLVSNIRHINALKECAANLNKAKEILQNGLSLEFLSEEIKAAVNALDKITGRNIDTDLLETIFSQFCIGK